MAFAEAALLYHISTHSLRYSLVTILTQFASKLKKRMVPRYRNAKSDVRVSDRVRNYPGMPDPELLEYQV